MCRCNILIHPNIPEHIKGQLFVYVPGVVQYIIQHTYTVQPREADRNGECLNLYVWCMDGILYKPNNTLVDHVETPVQSLATLALCIRKFPVICGILAKIP